MLVELQMCMRLNCGSLIRMTASFSQGNTVCGSNFKSELHYYDIYTIFNI